MLLLVYFQQSIEFCEIENSKNMKYQILGKINYIKKINSEFYHLKINTPQIALNAKPGQFVHIRCNDILFPFLRRPMSIFNVNKKNIEIIFQVKGAGTQILSQKKFEEELDILGPLGNGFTLTQQPYILLIGGGMGMVPLYYLAKELKRKKKKFEIFMGARSKSGLITLDFFKKLKMPLNISTDDGSFGFKGSIIELAENYLKSNNIDKNKIKVYSCGPHPMLIAIQKLVKKYCITCEISLEEYMGCGVGACFSCVCKSQNNQYKRICLEGPVFKADEVFLE